MWFLGRCDLRVCRIGAIQAFGRYGAKGAGESGTGAAPGVVMGAVNNALRPFNAVVTTQPMTPEIVLQALGKV